jgi:hypothetical protein
LAQFVPEVDAFRSLDDKIGAANEPGALPFLPPRDQEGPVTHIHITGVCDDTDLVDRFTNITSSIKHRADMEMEGVLVNLQLAPQAVVCLLHPLVNTEDFPEGIVMDNTGALGHNLLTDPARMFIAEATIPVDDIVIAGPLALRQCSDCHPTVKQAFIVRLAIEMPGSEIVVNDVAYEKWGFAVALINWNALIERSDIFERFADQNKEFQLSRTDIIVDQETLEETTRVSKHANKKKQYFVAYELWKLIPAGCTNYGV